MTNEVTVAEFRVGEHIALRGCWFKVASADDKSVTLEVVSVTAGSIKKQNRDWRKKNGKHWRRKARRDFAHSVNQERKRMAAECRAWLEAERVYEWLTAESQWLLADMATTDPALD